VRAKVLSSYYPCDINLLGIPTVPSGGNHTPEFAKAARTQEAHDATIVVMKGLALTGFRVLDDEIFFRQVGYQ
jgi:endonuclease V-like protein UPF0215 family